MNLIKEKLEKHRMWLYWEENGERANFKDADLRNVDLSCIDLSGAIFTGADLTGANLSSANLSGAVLEGANLEGANLSSANLREAHLSHANLKNVKTNMFTVGYHLECPEEGSFVAYKKAGNCLVKLLVLEDAKRSSATTPKCRCNKAKVLEIENLRLGLKVVEVPSNYDSKFIYRVGEIVTVDNFDDDRWNECAPGIHFFINRENAIQY